MPNQNDQFAAEQFYDKLHAQEITPQEEPEEPRFCLSAQWMKIVSEFLKAEKNDDMPEDPIKMATKVADSSDFIISKSISYKTIPDWHVSSDEAKQDLKESLYKTAATCLRMLKELNKTY